MSFFGSRHVPGFAITQQQKSVTGIYDIWTIDSGISYTGSTGWRITDPSILSSTEFDGLLHWVNPSMDG